MEPYLIANNAKENSPRQTMTVVLVSRIRQISGIQRLAGSRILVKILKQLIHVQQLLQMKMKTVKSFHQKNKLMLKAIGFNLLQLIVQLENLNILQI